MQRLSDGEEAVNCHGEEVGVRAIEEREADFEKETGVGEVDSVQEFGTKEGWKER